VEASERAQQLRLLREGRGLTQDALAKRLGVATSTVARWEHAGRTPRPMNAARLASALGISVDDLDAQA
jgi:transcriptional regulator with XRE-family HTH domain